MSIKNSFNVIAIVFVAFLMGCASPERSRTTGWNINDPRWGGFQVLHAVDQATPPGMVFIEGGSFVMGANHQDLLHTWDMIPRRVTVASFYMDETEVRNIDYNEYLYWLDRIFGQDFPEVVRRAWPDELAWRRVDAYVEHMVEFYFQHPAFNEYPVVGVTWEQAMDFNLWRTDRVNEQILIRLGFLQIDPNQTPDNHFNTAAFLAGQYVGSVRRQIPDMNPNAPERMRPVQLRDGILMPNFRLPTEAEWEYAALGLAGNTFDERIIERRVFPWNGHNVRMTDSRNMGQMRANFVRGRGDFAGVSGSLNDGGFFTVPVFSYAPNDFGLFNMAGNVAEWVLDVYRPSTFENIQHGLNPFRGNVFMTQVRDEDGNIAQRNELGRIPMQEMTPEQIGDRRNFQRADNRNFRDGDFSSVLTHNWLALAEQDDNTTAMAYDPTTTLITDRSRVVKGGSWADRAFFLHPANRRFLDQGQSEAWIGFRSAMPRVGNQSPANTGRR
ncbi:MAG: formylglycine-generating enzyme family protein [Bacteroidales bacterium]|nr:formylglycine-generating enzyme family protein [Bacteroidales bacterium]